MIMAHLGSVSSSYSVHSLAEGSEAISEAEEIQEVQKFQKKGDKAFESSNYADALQHYKDALEIDECNAEVLSSRAAAYLKMGNFILAQQDVEKLLLLQPKHPQGHYLLGISLENQGQYRDSLFAFLKAMDLDVNASNAAMLTDNIASLCVHFCQVPDVLMEQLPNMEPYKKLCEVGACLYAAKRYELCLYILGAAQKVATNQKGITMKVLLTMANAHSRLRHRDISISIYQECLSTAISAHDWQYQTKALVNIASLFLEAGNTHQAVVYYEKLLDLQREIRDNMNDGVLPDYWSPELECSLHLNASIAYKSIGTVHRALWHAEKYASLMDIQENKKHAQAQSHHNVGMLLEILGRPLQALASYKRFLEVSKAKGDKNNIARAYGCLGSVYGILCNKQMSLTYHDQHVSMARSFGDNKMLSIALEQLGDTYMKMDTPMDAVNAFTEMFQNTPRNDIHRQTTALCKLGSANKELGRYQYSLYYYEQAKIIAQDFEFADIKVFCEYNQACILQLSTQRYEMQQALGYFEKLIPLLEVKIHQHREEDTFCAQEMYAQLMRCYDGIQMLLKKFGKKEDCLIYAEASRKRQSALICAASSSPLANIAKVSGHAITFGAMWSMEKINHVISQQNSTVLYYSLQHDALLVWMLRPGQGIVSFHSLPSYQTPLDELLRDMIAEISKDKDLAEFKFSCENRSLPLKGSNVDRMKKQNESLSWLEGDTTSTEASDSQPEPSSTSTSSRTTTEISSESAQDEQFSPPEKSADRRLYDWLIAPLESALLKLDEESMITVIPDKSLYACPFPYLRSAENQRFGNRFRVTCVPNLFMFEQVCVNEMNDIKHHHDVEMARVQACAGGQARSHHSMSDQLTNTQSAFSNAKSSTISKLNETSDATPIDPKKTSHPHLAKSYTYTSLKWPSKGLSKMSTFVVDKNKVNQERKNQNMNTLAYKTSTGTDIATADCGTTQFKQVSKADKAVVMGAPALPERLNLHGGDWLPQGNMAGCQAECHRIANILEVKAILAADATKDRFLLEAPTATLLHLATIGCQQEAYLAFTPNASIEGGVPQEKSYLVKADDIAALTLVAKLVIISGAWSTRQKASAHDGFKLATAFLAAGAQCVLQLLWPIPADALEKFYFHLYTGLTDGSTISQAVQLAGTALKKDDSPFALIGKDVSLDVTELRHAMLNQTLDKVEAGVAQSFTRDPLNPETSTPEALSKPQYLRNLQECLSHILAQHAHQPHVLALIIDLMDGALKRLHLETNNSKVQTLEADVTNSESGLQLLKTLGFHFQPGSSSESMDRPYVIFPHSNLHELLLPTYDALRALIDMLDNPNACHCLCELLPTSQENISHLVDVLSISRHAPEIQLKVSDMSVRPLWQVPKIKVMLNAVGFHQIGPLLGFHNTPANRKLMLCFLQLLISVSCYKSPALLHKLDVSLLGASQGSIKGSEISLADVKLPSLTPLLLPGNQLRMQTPWLSRVEDVDEMTEKMRVAKSKSDLSSTFHQSAHRAKSWHKASLAAQAGTALEKFGQSKNKPAKVKVQTGATASCVRIPLDAAVKLTNLETSKRRDYAHFIMHQRLDHVALQHRQDTRRLYLPYVKN